MNLINGSGKREKDEIFMMITDFVGFLSQNGEDKRKGVEVGVMKWFDFLL